MKTTSSIQAWRSIRRFKPDRVPAESVRAVLEAGRRAPSWINLQPWHFVVLEDQGGKDVLAETCLAGESLRRAPVVLVICGDPTAFEDEKARASIRDLIDVGALAVPPEVVDSLIETPVISVEQHGAQMALARTLEALGTAYGFMCIEAVHQGLGACIFGTFGNSVNGFNKEKYLQAKRYLHIPDHLHILTCMFLGVPDEQPGPRPRKPFDAIVSRERYGQRF